ncbi:unnamed protein product [Arabis nemorensis]|uniref:Uncharacterized protein n=1 Tax=Arabis nemorensis TaxID=586526 RepID=A0A565CPU6_9BRAS|nr:unnamed protein product [Arabis nemorensis]
MSSEGSTRDVETQSRSVSSWLRPHDRAISKEEKGNESSGDSGNSVAGLFKSRTDAAKPNSFELLEVKSEPNEFETAVHTEAYKQVFGLAGPSQPGKKKRRVKKSVPDPPGSTLSTEDSLHDLRESCHFSEDIEILVPSSYCRADEPPEGFFTVYESYFHDCFLWFPIPYVILEFLKELELSISQITPRGIRHMVGILVRGYECDEDISAYHLLNLLEFRQSSPKNKFVYYASNKKDRRIIRGFPSKDRQWIDFFFYVPICEAILGNGIELIKTSWQRMGSRPVARFWPGSSSFSCR